MNETPDANERRARAGSRRGRRPKAVALAIALALVLVIGLVAATTIAARRGQAAVDAFDSRWGWGDTIISLVTSGEAVGSPDLLVADVTVESTASTATTAIDQVGRRRLAMIGALVSAGVARTDVATGAPDVRTGEPPVTAVGSAKVTVRQLADAPRLLGVIAAAGGVDPTASTRIDSVRYEISDASALLALARDRANASARTQAQAYADTIGMRLGELKSSSPLDPVTEDVAPSLEPPAPAPSALPSTPAVVDPPTRAPTPTPHVIRATVHSTWRVTAQ